MKRLILCSAFLITAIAIATSAGGTLGDDGGGIPAIRHQGASGFKGIPFAPYALGSNAGAIIIDGKLTYHDALGFPFSRVLLPEGRHQRPLPLTGWVKDDGDHLYIALDVSVGRTTRIPAGDASVLIKQPDGILEYRLQKAVPPYGMHGSFKTPKANQLHHVFEFKIPLKNLTSTSGSLELAFVASNRDQG